MNIPINVAASFLKSEERRFAKAVRLGLIRGAQRSRATIQRNTPKDTGQTKASWKIDIKPDAKAKEQAVAAWINDAMTAAILEMGAKPHAVNPAGWAAIYNWVRRHRQYFGIKRNSDLNRNKAGQFTGGRASDSAKETKPFRGPDPDISAITNGIVHKLKTEGQRPRYFVRNMLDELGKMASREVDAYLKEFMSRGAK